MRRVILVMGLVVAAGALSLGPAQAERRASFDSTVKIKDYVLDKKGKRGDGSFFAKVGSENANCKPERKASILRKQPGEDELIGSKSTNTHGRFSVVAPNQPGTYYAETGKDEIPAGTCKGAVSKNFKLF